jgi:hypothetical protein
MELLIVIGCGIFFFITAIFAYIRQQKDFEKYEKRQEEK